MSLLGSRVTFHALYLVRRFIRIVIIVGKLLYFYYIYILLYTICIRSVDAINIICTSEHEGENIKFKLLQKMQFIMINQNL